MFIWKIRIKRNFGFFLVLWELEEYRFLIELVGKVMFYFFKSIYYLEGLCERKYIEIYLVLRKLDR